MLDIFFKEEVKNMFDLRKKDVHRNEKRYETYAFPRTVPDAFAAQQNRKYLVSYEIELQSDLSSCTKCDRDVQIFLLQHFSVFAPSY